MEDYGLTIEDLFQEGEAFFETEQIRWQDEEDIRLAGGDEYLCGTDW